MKYKIRLKLGLKSELFVAKSPSPTFKGYEKICFVSDTAIERRVCNSKIPAIYRLVTMQLLEIYKQ